MQVLAFLPFILQAVLIGIDEIYFHYKRGLPKWERIGHPMDTLSTLLCFYLILFVPLTSFYLKVYIVLCVISCIMITKDEFVHKHFCPSAENWLHAFLFVLHPIILIMAGLMWGAISHLNMPLWISSWLNNNTFLEAFLIIQAILISLFFLYQIIFWNIVWKEKIVIKY